MNYNLKPVEVQKIKTKYRRIKTKLPVPKSIEILNSLMNSEPRSMMGQPPIVWHRAKGFQVWDKWGNKWIDWSSGVLITNVGHGRRKIRAVLKGLISRPLLATYVFAHEKRAELTRVLQLLSPDPANYDVFLLSTGSEAIENSIKLSKTFSLKKYGHRRKYMVSFKNAFHGRTLGAQLAGGMDKQRKWIVDEGRTFIRVPFPDGYKNENISFDLFLESLKTYNIKHDEISSNNRIISRSGTGFHSL